MRLVGTLLIFAHKISQGVQINFPDWDIKTILLPEIPDRGQQPGTIGSFTHGQPVYAAGNGRLQANVYPYAGFR